MKINDIVNESTTSGSVATVAQPLSTQRRSDVGAGIYPSKRGGNLLTGKKTSKKYANSINESELLEAPQLTSKTAVIDYFVSRGMTPAQGAAAWERGYRGGPSKRSLKSKKQMPTKSEPVVSTNTVSWKSPVKNMDEIAYDLEYMQNGNFKQKYGKTKDELKQRLGTPNINEKLSGIKEDNMKIENICDGISEAKLDEEDLILVPGVGRKIKSGFIPHDHSRVDHEVEMAKSDLFSAAKNAKQVYELIKDVTEDEGLDGWVQEKIIKANDYLNTIREYLEGKQVQEMTTAGVIAGGGVGEGLDEEGKGLWANIHAKRDRIKRGSGERMRKPGSKGAPSDQDFKDAAKEGMYEDDSSEDFKKGQTVFLKTKTMPTTPSQGKVEQVTDKYVIIKTVTGKYKAKRENVTTDRSQGYLAAYSRDTK